MKDTSQRILEAATRVFAREGVAGATTREIAHAAKVNEVTLFRHFKNKEELLSQVVKCNSKQFEHVFADASVDTAADVKNMIKVYVTAYARKLAENEDFIRTFFGELHRHEKLCRRLFVESAKTGRQKFIDYLTTAQKRGLIRRNLDIQTSADALTGMLLAGMIRRPLTEPFYDSKTYMDTCLKLFLKAIEP